MKRQWIVAALALAAAAAVAVWFVRGSNREKPAGSTAVAGGRVFANDSLGVRLRLPESAGWSLRPDALPRSDGRVVVALHEGAKSAGVSVFVLPMPADVTLSDIFKSRMRQMGSLFGVDDMSKAIAHVVRDTTSTCDGDPCRQYQAISLNALGPDEKPTRAMLMWMIRSHGGRAYECIGLTWAPVGAVSPEEQAASEALASDVAYIMQSFEVH